MIRLSKQNELLFNRLRETTRNIFLLKILDNFILQNLSGFYKPDRVWVNIEGLLVLQLVALVIQPAPI